ncbi:MAG: hypothetical protein RMJ00_01150 [Nitrososphaerota archaeon]|nr:hypothetical protein [Candidatus Bathyarchaeota archaeon]MCX8162804.1 hypothetical protein [Candidatus Bathyarchaeota archaeon]MDW8061294.1 hypothetical protein [Nitrososphaerota archaeon]
MLSELKKEFLKLLREDSEFRYTVAGLIGLDEILRRLEKHDEKFNEVLERLDRHEQLFLEVFKRLDRHEDELLKLRQDMVEGFKRYDEILEKHGEEIRRLREDMVEGFKRHDEEIAKLRQDMVEGFKRYDEILTKHFEILEKHSEEIRRLRKGFDLLAGIVRRMDARLSRVERTLDKITLDIEEEAREILRGRLKRMGYEIDLKPLRLPRLEIDIYGVYEDLCILGEAKVRLGVRTLDRFLGRIERLEKLYPDKLKPRRIVLVYTCLATDDAVEKAKEKCVWVLKALEDITPFTIIES